MDTRHPARSKASASHAPIDPAPTIATDELTKATIAAKQIFGVCELAPQKFAQTATVIAAADEVPTFNSGYIQLYLQVIT
jgi:hypothetical protein